MTLLLRHVSAGVNSHKTPQSWPSRASYVVSIVRISKTIDGFVQNCSISFANVLEILQSYTTPSKWQCYNNMTSQWTRNAIITSLLRQNDVPTSFWRNNDVIIASCIRWGYLLLECPVVCSRSFHTRILIRAGLHRMRDLQEIKVS